MKGHYRSGGKIADQFFLFVSEHGEVGSAIQHMFKYLAKLALLTGLFGNLLAAEPVVETEQLSRVPPTPPEKALETFQIKDGFRLELAAAEPLVVDPIAICFDENSRMFVVEMRDYSERRDERLGRIRM